MRYKWRLLGVVVWVTAVFILAACQSETANEGVSAPEQTPTPMREKLVAPDIKSEKGLGSLFGKITWNNLPAEGLDVQICQEFNAFSGCKGQEYTVQTAGDGTYTFRNVEPGDYALSIRVFDTDEWIYATDGILSAAEYAVTADQTLTIEPRSIFKLDLQPLKPDQAAELKSGQQTFQWRPYESADYYHIYLTPAEGEAIYVNQRVDEVQITAQLLPLNCEYRWSVEAFNADGVKIAETSDYWDFAVIGEDASCHLTIEKPKDGAAIAAQDIVLDWTPHPDAANYKILMWDDDSEDKTKTLDFYEVKESDFIFNGELISGHRYVWSVYAYNENGDEIAASEIHDFKIE